MLGASAQTQASSKPMGYVTWIAKGNSDTRIGAPVHRKAAFVGKVDSVATNVITVDGNDPGWTADQFTDPAYDPVTSPDVPPTTDLYFVLIAGGTMEGRHFEVTANGSNTLTVDVGAEQTAFTAAVVNGTSLKLIPYWTLDSLFPAGAGVHPSPNFGTLNTQILTPSTMSAGTNLSNSATFFYYDGSLGGGFATPQWQKSGAPPSTGFGKHPLPPDVQMIVRHDIAGDTEICPIGDVYTTAFRTPVNILATGVDQDNAVFLTVPLDVSLEDSNLFQSGAFDGNTTFSADASDSLLVFDNTAVSQNKANAKTYFYYTEPGFGGPGWRQAGEPPFNIKNADIAFSLDSQVLFRKKGGDVGSSIWEMTPTYLPFP